MPVIYAFECKGIQDYILANNRMRYMVGASEAVEQLTHKDGLLDQVLKVLGLTEEQAPNFARRAGGALWALFTNKTQASRFHELWTLAVASHLPGLTFVHALVEGDHLPTMEVELQRDLRRARNRGRPPLPAAAPYAERAPRTGLPAVRIAAEEMLDEATLAKDQYAQKKLSEGKELLAEKFNPRDPEVDQRFCWPLELTPVPDAGEPLFPAEDEGWAAVIHADGNGLGAILHKVKARAREKLDQYADMLRAFSEAVNRATEGAARCAAAELVDQKRPMVDRIFMAGRPLVLGGDDLTIITRGEVAISFAETFLQKFEEFTEEEFGKLPDLKGCFPDGKMTACAGIAFIKPKQPFHMAYRLAESLCRHAKNRLRASSTDDGSNTDQPQSTVSALAFHRITSSMIEDYPDIIKRELSLPRREPDPVAPASENRPDRAESARQMTLQPYAVTGQAHTLPRLSHLLDLHDSLKKTGRSTVRELARLVRLEHGSLEPRKRRWLETMDKNEPGQLADLKAGFKALLAEEHEEFPLWNRQGHCPLGDALALLAVGAKTKGEHHD